MSGFERKHWTEIESCVRDEAAKLPRINGKGLEVAHWDRAIEVACKWIAGLRETVADLERERDHLRDDYAAADATARTLQQENEALRAWIKADRGVEDPDLSRWMEKTT